MSERPTDPNYDEVLRANIALHSRLADDYARCEPHFRPENVRRVEAILVDLVRRAGGERLLDLGCGTGFMIEIAKPHVRHVTGVDVTQAMLDKVDRSGPATIELLNCDTASVELEPAAYDVVTAYSFLHHLYDVRPTLATAFRALRAGGSFYADLDPNFYFWSEIHALDREGSYDPIVRREIEMVAFKDEDIERSFGVDREVFNKAEYGKNIAGGFREEDLVRLLRDAGFRAVELRYSWFLGQGALINDADMREDERFRHAEVMEGMLRRALPVSRSLFKYLGFVATK